MHSTIKDQDPVLVINKANRRITVPAACRIIGAAADRHSEQLTIQAPRYIEGHDVAGCSAVWIIWTDAKGRTGKQVITGKAVTAETVRVTWAPVPEVTQQAGALAFSVNFVDLGGDGEVLYKWGTELCKDVRVAETVWTRTEADLRLDDDGLLQIDVDEATINAAAYNAVRSELYG